MFRIHWRHNFSIRLRTSSRFRLPSFDSSWMCWSVYCWRIFWKDVSVGVGVEASTTGKAGVTSRPPILMDMGGVGVLMVCSLCLLKG